MIELLIDRVIIHYFLAFQFLVNDFTPVIREAASALTVWLRVRLTVDHEKVLLVRLTEYPAARKMSLAHGCVMSMLSTFKWYLIV